jgi:hypothetical protein
MSNVAEGAEQAMTPASYGPRNLLAERLAGETPIRIPHPTTRATSLTRS